MSNDLETKLRALHDEHCQYCDGGSAVSASCFANFRVAAALGAAAAYVDAEIAAFDFVSSHPDCPSSAFAHDVANVIAARAASTGSKP